MNLAAFLIRFPEFSEERAPTDMIEQALAQASRAVSGSVWGSQLADAQGFYAAHILAMSPWGQQARLDDGTRSTYGEQLKALRKSIVPGALVSSF